jgi:dolichol-phosphate mannosyltransferase
VLAQVLRYSADVLVVDDGSTDGTSELLDSRDDIQIARHSLNRGYGAALHTAFDYALAHGYETLVTIDCDGQHQPQLIPRFVSAARHLDIVSGSRYLEILPGQSRPPEDRRKINATLTASINRRLGLNLSDAFCGFKAYRVEKLACLEITETGYAMPLEVWVQAAALGLKIGELPVPLLYLDEKRSFGGALDDAQTRLAHYFDVLDRAVARAAQQTARWADCRTKSSACGEGA